ncbi:MAG: BON domain-containing protein [Candidatus Korobacteraceae bacterium]|jgi:hyperosmotically inducible protein
MGKAGGIVAVVLALSFLAVAAGAQSAQPPMSNQSMSNQPAPAQAPPPEAALPPEAQAKIAKAINHNVIMLPYYGIFDSLSYQLQGRTVILTGEVTNPSLKPDAERAVKKVEGVDKVVNNIEILPPSPIDQQIRERVRKTIYSYGPLFKYSRDPNPPIRIIVKNSRVTLEGVVDSEGDKNLCTLRVNQISSVLSVTNNLRVVK